MLRFMLVWCVKAYVVTISPFLGRNCRFKTSCSKNMIASLENHGFVLGLFLGTSQILRCTPWYSGDRDV